MSPHYCEILLRIARVMGIGFTVLLRLNKLEKLKQSNSNWTFAQRGPKSNQALNLGNDNWRHSYKISELIKWCLIDTTFELDPINKENSGETWKNQRYSNPIKKVGNKKS